MKMPACYEKPLFEYRIPLVVKCALLKSALRRTSITSCMRMCDPMRVFLTVSVFVEFPAMDVALANGLDRLSIARWKISSNLSMISYPQS